MHHGSGENMIDIISMYYNLITSRSLYIHEHDEV